jgi:hypothetical protein
VESAVEEMSTAIDVAIVDSQKMLFSNVKTLVVDPKQQCALTSILKRGTKTDVGKVVTPPASLPPEMVSDEKPFNACPVLNMVILHLCGPRQLTPILTRATVIRR